jgi:hypothetical protein
MLNLFDIYLDLLQESKTPQKIEEILRFYIEGNFRCKILYMGDNTQQKGWRTVEPFAMGEHVTSNNLLLRALQITRTKSDTPNGNGKDPLTFLPNGWRLFDVKYIKDVKPGGGKFQPNKRGEYNPNDKVLKNNNRYIAVSKTTKRVGDLFQKGQEQTEDNN